MTGNLLALIACGFMSLARADGGGIQFRAEVDRNQVSMDESISLKLTIENDDGGSVRASEPEFDAPGFEVLNEYRSTRSMLTDYNGQMSTKTTTEITKVLRPEKAGTFRIGSLRVKVDGKVYTAPDVSVTVVAAGTNTPPPRDYGGGGVGLRGAGKHAATSVFVRAEVDKDKVYKGEQVVVSYYLYQRVKVFNIDINKYPTLNGFLREDLEMPVITRQLIRRARGARRRSLRALPARPLRRLSAPGRHAQDRPDGPQVQLLLRAGPGGSRQQRRPVHDVLPAARAAHRDDVERAARRRVDAASRGGAAGVVHRSGR